MHFPILANHSTSAFDVVLSGHLDTSTVVHSTEILAECARVLKPNGQICISEPSSARNADSLKSALIIAGFVNAEKVKIPSIDLIDLGSLRNLLSSHTINIKL